MLSTSVFDQDWLVSLWRRPLAPSRQQRGLHFLRIYLIVIWLSWNILRDWRFCSGRDDEVNGGIFGYCFLVYCSEAASQQTIMVPAGVRLWIFRCLIWQSSSRAVSTASNNCWRTRGLSTLPYYNIIASDNATAYMYGGCICRWSATWRSPCCPGCRIGSFLLGHCMRSNRFAPHVKWAWLIQIYIQHICIIYVLDFNSLMSFWRQLVMLLKCFAETNPRSDIVWVFSVAIAQVRLVLKEPYVGVVKANYSKFRLGWRCQGFVPGYPSMRSVLVRYSSRCGMVWLNPRWLFSRFPADKWGWRLTFWLACWLTDWLTETSTGLLCWMKGLGRNNKGKAFCQQKYAATAGGVLVVSVSAMFVVVATGATDLHHRDWYRRMENSLGISAGMDDVVVVCRGRKG